MKTLAVCLAALLAVGCGGEKDGDELSTAEEPTSFAIRDDVTIVGIHGLRPKPANLSEIWREAIAHGLRENEGLEIKASDLPISMAQWKKELPDGPSCERRDKAVGSPPGWEHGLSAPWDAAMELLGLGDFDNRSRELDKLGALLPWPVFEEDLRAYYSTFGTPDTGTRREYYKELEPLLRGERKVLLIAHSMGSIIAYDYLLTAPANKRVYHLLTIGSPLGLGPIEGENAFQTAQGDKDERAPLRVPSEVERWTNLADRFDPIAIDDKLGDDYGPTGSAGVRIEDDLVKTWERTTLPEAFRSIGTAIASGSISGVPTTLADLRREGHLARFHEACGYLQTPEVSRLVRSFLKDK